MTAMPIVPNVPPIAKRLADFIEKWRAARWDPERGELSDCGHGDYSDGPYWTHGWWMTPQDWSLGISLATDEWVERYAITFTAEFGPFAWSFTFCPSGAIR